MYKWWCVQTYDWVRVAFVLRIPLILKYTQFLCNVYGMCARIYEYMALIRYANKYRYFYANIALLSRVHVETCRIRFFNLLNWVLFCCSRSHSHCCCCWWRWWCCYFSWMSLFLLWIYSFGYFHLLLASFWVDIRIGCSRFTSLIHLNTVLVFATVVWTVWTQLNHDTMPHRATAGFFSLFRRLFPLPFLRSFSWVFFQWNVKHITLTKQAANLPAISEKISVQQFDVVLYTTAWIRYVCVCICVSIQHTWAIE